MSELTHGRHEKYDEPGSSHRYRPRTPIVGHGVGHCSEAVASIEHVTFGDSTEVLRAIKVEDGDPAVSVAWLTCGEGGHLRGLEESTRVMAFSAHSTVPNDLDVRVWQPLSSAGAKSNIASATAKVGALWAGRLRRGRYIWSRGSSFSVTWPSEPASARAMALRRPCWRIDDPKFDALVGKGSRGEIGRLTDGIGGIRRRERRWGQSRAIVGSGGGGVRIMIGKGNWA